MCIQLLDPDSAINSHQHVTDSEIYFKPNLQNHSWISLGLCSNGESHYAQRPAYYNGESTVLDGIRAGIKLEQPVTDIIRRRIIEQYLIDNILPSIHSNSNLNNYGFKTRAEDPEICIVQAVDDGTFRTFAITGHSKSMHIINTKPARVSEKTLLTGTITPNDISNLYDVLYNGER